jgi:hypothetical protein
MPSLREKRLAGAELRDAGAKVSAAGLGAALELGSVLESR